MAITTPGMMYRPQTLQNQLADWFMRLTPPSGVRRVMPVSAAVASDTGLVRGENQDRVAVARGQTKSGKVFALAAIADGIGGMKDGAACASHALAQLFSSAFNDSRLGENPALSLESAVRDANELLHSQTGLKGGTTLVAMLLVEGQPVFWTSIGDSRIYRASKTELVQLSDDDTIAGQLGKRGDITSEQSKLLQFLGIGEPIEIRVERADGETDDFAILTTDGAHFLERAGGVFSVVVRNSPDLGTCVRRLTELARWAGGPDNASAVAIPFLPDLRKHPIPPLCLDVWDPFGEIRVLGQPTESAASSRPQQSAAATGQTLSKSDQRSEKPSESPVEKEREKAGEKKAERPKRKRKSRKKTELRGEKAPQVQLEFSGKDK